MHFCNDMNWNDIRYFLSLRDQGSLNRAAEHLGVNQSTVFRRIRELEKDLGATLFDRRHSGEYRLTPHGELLLDQARAMESASTNITQQIQGKDEELSGLIRVTAPEDVAVLSLSRHLVEFKQLYPGISIELLTSSRYFSLHRGEADIAIRASGAPTEDNVIPRKLADVSASLFASPDYLEKTGHPKNEDELSRHNLIGWAGELDGGNPAFFVSDNKPISSNSLLVQKALAEQGMGIALLPDFLGMTSAHLIQVLPQLKQSISTLWLLYHSELRHTARIQAFVNFIQSALRNDLSPSGFEDNQKSVLPS